MATLILPASIQAHAVFMTYVRHDTTIDIDARNIDITAELTFYEIESLAERRRMDANDDGTIAPAEIDAYLDARADQFLDSVGLTIDGESLKLTPLFDPEIDLGETDAIAPVHHVLRLYFFARTPPALKAGRNLVWSDGLWASVPAIVGMTLEAEDGFDVQAEPPGDPLDAPTDDQGRRVAKAECLAAPEHLAPAAHAGDEDLEARTSAANDAGSVDGAPPAGIAATVDTGDSGWFSAALLATGCVLVLFTVSAAGARMVRGRRRREMGGCPCDDASTGSE